MRARKVGQKKIEAAVLDGFVRKNERNPKEAEIIKISAEIARAYRAIQFLEYVASTSGGTKMETTVGQIRLNQKTKKPPKSTNGTEAELDPDIF